MINIQLPDEIAQRLEEIARHQNRSVADILEAWLDEHQEETPKAVPNWDMILGIGDENVTDMSTTVRETLEQYFQDKYGDTD